MFEITENETQKNYSYYFSEGLDCGMKNSYSINVHVPNYIAWIKQVMGSELLCNR